jgi:hypothetical protein
MSILPNVTENIIINDMKFEVNYQQKSDSIRFFIKKNLKNDGVRFMETSIHEKILNYYHIIKYHQYLTKIFYY